MGLPETDDHAAAVDDPGRLAKSQTAGAYFELSISAARAGEVARIVTATNTAGTDWRKKPYIMTHFPRFRAPIVSAGAGPPCRLGKARAL
jgi:hypothetical protein